jgi:sirohydrochlorin ferrochelatase
VVAPDRGFLGNEETRDAFEAFAAGRNAALVFVTDERPGATVDAALRAVGSKGARRLVVLPFFFSRGDPRYARVASLLEARAPKLPVSWARPFGESYFAVEQPRTGCARSASGKARVIVVGAGAGRRCAAAHAPGLERRRGRIRGSDSSPCAPSSNPPGEAGASRRRHAGQIVR